MLAKLISYFHVARKDDTGSAFLFCFLMENIMVASVHSINADMTIRDAIRELLKHAIGGAPVIDSQKKVLTVVSEGDLLRLAASMGLEKTIFQMPLDAVW